jgi:integrase
MASFRKRSNGKWLAEVRVQGVAHVRKTFGLKGDAKIWAAAEEARIKSGGSVTRETLSWLISQYQATRTKTLYEDGILQWWNTRLGKMKLSDLHRKHFKLARAAMVATPKERGTGTLAPATVNRRVAAISAVIAHGIEELELLDNNPARMRVLTENKQRNRLLTEDEPIRLLDACRDFKSGLADAQPEPALYLLARLAMMTGARAGELLKLRWSDVNLEDGYIIFRDTKNGDIRPAPIAGSALSGSEGKCVQ